MCRIQDPQTPHHPGDRGCFEGIQQSDTREDLQNTILDILEVLSLNYVKYHVLWLQPC